MTASAAAVSAEDPRTGAALRAARRMGVSRLFLQAMAQEMPDGALVDLRLEETHGCVVARVRHLCVAGCDLSPAHCLTALKLQALVGRQRRTPHAIVAVALEDEVLRVELVPLPTA